MCGLTIMKLPCLHPLQSEALFLLLLVLRPFSVLMECSGGSGMDTRFALSSRAVTTSDAGTLLLLSILPMQL